MNEFCYVDEFLHKGRSYLVVFLSSMKGFEKKINSPRFRGFGANFERILPQNIVETSYIKKFITEK